MTTTVNRRDEHKTDSIIYSLGMVLLQNLGEFVIAINLRIKGPNFFEIVMLQKTAQSNALKHQSNGNTLKFSEQLT